ncbi:MAG: CDP-glycerol glycerophosphotransferase family protein [Methanobrevibacter sp.]|uniref:CDP-glycerol glycerophosphotransferase family protein n=1 Tax=Methanobrevibacter sp. TaxID=66852 RepID=UPI0025E179EB|nr:CDP-glycerol glycerophosphotransferase family protein [Methanobrevibacter sp.]MBQ6099767.1 CDP-glycerol glycerophosphotransferase family protein [Methanobrevibacter sp.]
MSEFKFSIIIAAYNSEEGIEKCIKSIIKQTLTFKDNTEIILINDGSRDNTGEICESFASKYPENITYISKKHEGNGSSRNLGLEYARGDYIQFLDGDDYLSRNTLKNVSDFFQENNNVEIVSIPTTFLKSDNSYPYFDLKYEKTRVVSLIEFPEFIQVQTNPCFFKRDLIKHAKFSHQIKLSEEIYFLNNLLIDNSNLGICSECRYYNNRIMEKSALLNIISNSKEVDGDKVRYYLRNLIERGVEKYTQIPDFIQNTILYYFNEIILNESINEKLTPQEIKRLSSEMRDILKYIDDRNIYNKIHIDEKIKTFLVFLKNDYSYKREDFFKLTKSLKLDTVFIDIYEIINDELYIMANINSIDFDEKIEVYVNDEKIETKIIDFPQREKYYLNERYLINTTFEFRLKLNENKNYNLKFKSAIYGDLHIDFSRPCNFSKVVGYAKTKKYLSSLKNDQINITKKTKIRWIKKELKALGKMLKNKSPGFETAIPIRAIYFALYPFLKNKRIWFYMDFPTLADDNGMHLFRYSVKQNDEDIKKYFVIDKNSKDYEKMKEIGPVISYHSIKHRILGLFAEKIITSHPDNNYIYAFWGHYPNFAGILKSSTIFLQHGITLNNISSWLNKFDKNLDFLLTASKKEYDSLFKYYYNYDEDIIQLLGFPRFDNLRDEKTRTILLMPTWRRYLNNENKYTISNSSYLKAYNSLINNKKLIEKLKENNYTIIFRPHPHVYNFISLFDENEYIRIDYERGSYQDLFKTGALLITDYSSVAFDFAYLKKPVLYYQYGEDYHFNLDESYFNFETMGFGEVCSNEDELVELVGEYIENDCKMKEKHVKNVEDYFIFTDKNNCKRVHDAIKKLQPRE